MYFLNNHPMPFIILGLLIGLVLFLIVITKIKSTVFTIKSGLKLIAYDFDCLDKKIKKMEFDLQLPSTTTRFKIGDGPDYLNHQKNAEKLQRDLNKDPRTDSIPRQVEWANPPWEKLGIRKGKSPAPSSGSPLRKEQKPKRKKLPQRTINIAKLYAEGWSREHIALKYKMTVAGIDYQLERLGKLLTTI